MSRRRRCATTKYRVKKARFGIQSRDGKLTILGVVTRMMLPAPHYRGLRALALLSAIYLAIMLAWGYHAHWALRDGERAAVLLAVVLSFLSPLVFPRCRRSHRVLVMLFTYVMLIVFSNFSAALGYFLVTTDAPLVDATLSRWDVALGFDWVAYCR